MYFFEFARASVSLFKMVTLFLKKKSFPGVDFQCISWGKNGNKNLKKINCTF
jgi:hypothetical protein